MRRAAIVVGVAGLVAVLVVWRCTSSRSEAPEADDPSASSSAQNRPAHVEPKVANASISGRVLVEGGGPIAHARVCVRGDVDQNEEPICRVADETGAYTVGTLVPASYVVSAAADTFRPAIHGGPGKRELLLAAGEQKTGVDVVLRPGGVELVGTVVDVTGGPIAKAHVSAETSSWGGRGRPIATTEADLRGRFRMWVSPGMTLVQASAQGYARRWSTVDAPATIELALTPGSSLTGTVVDATTNEPVAGVRVFARGLAYEGSGSAVTNDVGGFRIDGLTPGRYEAKAQTEHGFAASAGSVLVGLGQDVGDVVLKLWPAHRIEGRVVVSTTKADCPDAAISLEDPARDRFDWGRRRPDGTIAADGVLPGTYKVVAECPGYLTRKNYPNITIADRDVVGAVWEVDPGASLRGRVLTKAGEPVETGSVFARITSKHDGAFRNGWQHAAVERDGSYEIRGLTAGTYSITFTKNERRDGYDRRDGVEIEIPAGGSVDHDITIDVGTVAGIVVDADGRPRREAHVSAIGSHEQGTATSDVAGRFRMEVPAGEYQVVAQRDLEDIPSEAEIEKRGQRVVVVSTKTVEVRLVEKAPDGAITGTVVDVDGKPVSDAYVYAAPVGASGGARSSWNDDDPGTLTSVDGAFRLAGLAAGTYSVHAYRKGGGQADADKVAIGTSTTLRMKRTATLQGVARHAGKPIVDLAIEVEYPKTWFRRGEQFFRTDGRFALRDLPAGHLQLVAIADGLRTNMEVDVVEGETTTITVDVASHVSLTGRVVELGTTTPVGGVEVVVKLADAVMTMYGENDPRAVTDASGRFTVANVPIGRISIAGWSSATPRDGSFSTTRTITGSTIDVGDLSLVRPRIKDREWPGELGFEIHNGLTWAISSQQKLQVTSIDPAGPAARSGLAVGDVITSVDGYDVRGENVYVAELLRAPAGTKVTLGVARGATVSITLAPNARATP